MSRTGAKPPPPASEPQRYEDALNELEVLVAQMEAGQLPLDQLLQSFQRGTQLLGYCRTQLETVQAQVKILEDGQLKTWSNN